LEGVAGTHQVKSTALDSKMHDWPGIGERFQKKSRDGAPKSLELHHVTAIT